MRLHLLSAVLLLLLSSSIGFAAPSADPIESLRNAQTPQRIVQATEAIRARMFGSSWEGYYGREVDIARAVRVRLRTCPAHRVFSALRTVLLLTPISIQDPSLAVELYRKIPLQCFARHSENWDDWVSLWQDGLGLFKFEQNHQSAMTEEAISILKITLSHPPYHRHIGQITRILWRDLSGPFKIQLTAQELELMIRKNSYEGLLFLPAVFVRLEGRAGTEALIYLLTYPQLSHDLSRPDRELQQINILDALRKRNLSQADLDRIQRALTQHRIQLYRGARRVWTELVGRIRAGQGQDKATPMQEMTRWAQAIKDDNPETRVQAVAQMVRYLSVHPQNMRVRGQLRHLVSQDPDVRVRSAAWFGLMIIGDRDYRWESMLTQLSSAKQAGHVLRLLQSIPNVNWFFTAIDATGAVVFVDMPHKLVDRLVELLETDPDAARKKQILMVLEKVVRVFQDQLSRHIPPENSAFKERVQKKRDWIITAVEPHLIKLLRHADSTLRRQAIHWFIYFPTQNPQIVAYLVSALTDSKTRDVAIAALQKILVAPPGFAKQIQSIMQQSLWDANQKRHLHAIWLRGLCYDPEALETLSKIILRQEGDYRLRNQLAERCKLSPTQTHLLLQRLHKPLVQDIVYPKAAMDAFWALVKGVGGAQDLEDISPWRMLKRMGAENIINDWLLETAMSQPDWQIRNRLLQQLDIQQLTDIKEGKTRILKALITDVQTKDFSSKEFYIYGKLLGYEAILALAEAFKGNGNLLKKAAQTIEPPPRLYPTTDYKEPKSVYLPRMMQLIKEVVMDDHRLHEMLKLLRIKKFASISLRNARLLWKIGITPLLLEVMNTPKRCWVVRDVMSAVMGRILPPLCSVRRETSRWEESDEIF